MFARRRYGDRLCRFAADAGCRVIVGRYVPTEKNGPCAGFLSECGFTKTPEDCWERRLAGPILPRRECARVEAVTS